MLRLNFYNPYLCLPIIRIVLIKEAMFDPARNQVNIFICRTIYYLLVTEKIKKYVLAIIKCSYCYVFHEIRKNMMVKSHNYKAIISSFQEG